MATRGIHTGQWVFAQDGRCDYIGMVIDTTEFGVVLGSPVWICSSKLSNLFQLGWKSEAKMDKLCETLNQPEHWIHVSWNARFHPWPHGSYESKK